MKNSGNFILFIICLFLGHLTFAKPSMYKTGFSSIKEFNNLVIDLEDKIKNKPETITEQELNTTLAKIDDHYQTYFKQAGISFTLVQSKTYSIKHLFGKEIGYFNVIKYSLTGTEDGDEFSRFLYGVQKNKRFEKFPLKVELNPFHMIEDPSSYAYYDSTNNRISISNTVLFMDMSGVSSTLAHEMHHYYEQVKLWNGEQTLARIALRNSPAKERDDGYTNFLRIDEFETHILDLRSFVNTKRVQGRWEKLSAQLDEEKLANIKKYYSLKRQYDFKEVPMISKSLSEAVNYVLDPKNDINVNVNIVNGEVIATFEDLHGNYNEMSVNLYGLVDMEDIKNQELLYTKLNDVLSWTKVRAAKLDKEFEYLFKKLIESAKQ